MNSLLDGTSEPRYRPSLEVSGSTMLAATKVTEVTSESIQWAQSAHEQMVAARRERIAITAYLMAEARGFEPGHDADDWLRAQSLVDAEDAGISQILTV